MKLVGHSLLAVVLTVTAPFALVTATGCKLIKANPQPGVANFYPQTALVLNDFGGLLEQAEADVETAHQLGALDDAQFASALKVFKLVGQEGVAVTSMAQAGGSQSTIVLQIQSISTQVGNMPDAFGIKDPNSQVAFKAVVSAMQALLAQSISLVSQSK